MTSTSLPDSEIFITALSIIMSLLMFAKDNFFSVIFAIAGKTLIGLIYLYSVANGTLSNGVTIALFH